MNTQRSGTVGATEIVEALSSPARAKTFATRISQLIKDAKVDERVSRGATGLILVAKAIYAF